MMLITRQLPDDGRYHDVLCGAQEPLVVDRVALWSMDCMPYEPVKIHFKYNLRLFEHAATRILLVSQLEHSRNYVDPQQNRWSIQHRAWSYSVVEDSWTPSWKVRLGEHGDAVDERCPELVELLSNAALIEAVTQFSP